MREADQYQGHGYDPKLNAILDDLLASVDFSNQTFSNSL